MKKIIFCLLFIVKCLPGFAQYCHKINIADNKVKKQILADYIKDCEKKRIFFDDKGIIELKIYKDQFNRTCWYLSGLVDDMYKDNPTDKYSRYLGYIILIHKKDEKTIYSKDSLNACLSEIIGNSVYRRPPKVDKWYEYIDPSGKKKRTKRIVLSYENTWNGLIITFNKNGTYETLIPI